MLNLMKATTIVLGFLAFLISSLSAQEVPSTIERYLNSRVVENGFDGTVLVARGDEVLINKNFAPPGTPGAKFGRVQNRFPAGAIAEQFIAAAILQLERAGQVRFDSPICDYISDCPHEWRQIHILDLLTHSSGLPSLEGITPCLESTASQSYSSVVIHTLASRPLLFKPGNRFNGNKVDYFFLALALEKISGQSTIGYLKEHIFHPLKLAQTEYLFPIRQQNPTETTRQDVCPQAVPAANSMPSFFTEELYTTTNDLYRWGRTLTTKKLLPKDLVDQMLTPQIEGHGFGWKIMKEFDRKAILQNNEIEPTSVSIRMYPDDDTCIIVVSHVKSVSSSLLSHDLGAILFGKHYPVSAKPASVPLLH
jgi:CubicO group peptidase (beta-lactamase class C family)